MAEYAPVFKPGSRITHVAQGDVKAGTLVETVGDYIVRTAVADSTKVEGVAMADAADGEALVVEDLGVHRLVSVGAAVVAGDRIAPAAGGGIKKATGASIGRVEAGAAAGAVAEVKLTIV
jgi:Uncharacterized conserved protein (DUF2190)